MRSDKYIDSYLASFSRLGDSNGIFKGLSSLPTMAEIKALEDSLLNLLYPGRSLSCPKDSLETAVVFEMEYFMSLLDKTVYYAFKSDEMYRTQPDDLVHRRTDEVVDSLMGELGKIRTLLKKDAQAGLDGDPAARSLTEVIICYPAFRALAVHRVAHHLFRQGVPLIPRMMSELVHSQSGIDIHPGASIGESFFIDHGTGVVIGETAVIGNGVKIYQGVTLGALSFPKDACGQLLKGAKRHPTIEDNVTIYANATVLGDITIGHNSTIGSSCWIKEPIPPNTRVVNRDPEMVLISKR